jgi:hypothetical protein
MHQNRRAARGRILRVELDRSAATPLYMQISESIRADIASGPLIPEMRLPSSPLVRQAWMFWP